ncbi:Sds3-like-domain-containing protein [Apodospora peruviana]|uniref:Sds3-like-domain-containing protein n=1 Tax=Apodospora peruviana TaxID=516989 RepID=A0AAE0HYF3_9PEZI|nr:Sds3-like-domain-containing protein [Apodospora peruviana]
MATNDFNMADTPSQRPDRRMAGSPPPPQSKRDKRRQLLAERIATLSEKQANGQDKLFREKLQKIQIDTNLVMRYDPYVDRPLDEFEEDQERLRQLNGDSDSNPRTLLEMAGPRFANWMENIQDLVEKRDFALTKYKLDYEKKVSEYNNVHAYKLETAKREHRALSQTLRDRLINAITSKKFRLNKEKEALEISEGSALLLHPNQFSITNPASPGGTHSKRATRLRREMDEMTGIENKKRKRNDDDGSPAPQRRALDPSSTTPLWQTDRLAMRKVTGPILTIDKLFTDKELTLNYNTAALAAHKWLLTHKPKFDEHGQPLLSLDGSDSGNGDHDDQDGSDSVPSAPMMERNVSHATRSARGGAKENPNFTDDKLIGLEALANFTFPGNFERMVGADPKLPPTFPSTYVKGHTKQSDFNTPTALPVDDVNGDWMVIQTLKQYDNVNGVGANLSSDNGSRKLLEAMAAPPVAEKFVSYLQGNRPSENEVRKRLGLPMVVEPNPDQVNALEPAPASTPSKTGRAGTPAQQSPAKGLGIGPGAIAAPALGGVSMSRQSSANGAPMSRSSSRKGRVTRGG